MSSEREEENSGGPGQSRPGEPGYEGEVGVGEEGGHTTGQSEESSRSEEERVDEASEDSFPASDPPAPSDTT